MDQLGGHPYFLNNFFIFYNKSRSNLKVRLTTAIVYLYHKYFVVTLKLTNYAENTSLTSLWVSFFIIFRGNSYIEAEYRQSTVKRCNVFAREKYSRPTVILHYINRFLLLLAFEAAAESLKERLLRRTYLTRIYARESFIRETL